MPARSRAAERDHVAPRALVAVREVEADRRSCRRRTRAAAGPRARCRRRGPRPRRAPCCRARARCGARRRTLRRVVVDAQRERVGGDVPALVGGHERERVGACGEPRRRPAGLQDAARRERRHERLAVRRELLQPERAGLDERERERDDAVHERVRRRRGSARAPARRGRGGGGPAPKTVSGPGAPMSSACAARRSRTRCATLPAPPAAATSAHSSAAAPPTCGVAQEVPPQALTSSDSGSPGVISTFVGAEMSGLRRPSSVGPSDEYDSGSSVVASKAPTEKAPRRVARRGRARGRDLRRRREVHAAVERQVRRRRVADAPAPPRSTARRRRSIPAACRRAGRAARRARGTGSAGCVCLSIAGIVSAASV